MNVEVIGDHLGGTARRARDAGGYYTTGSLKRRLNRGGGGFRRRSRVRLANRFAGGFRTRFARSGHAGAARGFPGAKTDRYKAFRVESLRGRARRLRSR
ncbi:hypothetical protein [Burkholderia perseverans]|uniref:hypothetical protein n=1 Tax=Burkholderia perseverans TaxID=2615214 RepID=UPI001FED2F58|nr:hypothetical protein [Burkholderia perseverans]